MTVEILRYKPMNKGSLIGFSDLYIPKFGIEIYGISYFSKDGKEWVTMPQKEYTNKEGEKKFSSIVRFKERNSAEAFSRAVIIAIKAYKVPEERKVESQSNMFDEVPF